MIVEKRTLPIGVEYEGKLHRELQIRPRIVADMVDALEDERSQKNNRYYGLAMTARQIVKLGDIPKDAITAELLLAMYEKDYDTLVEAAETAQNRVEAFCRDREHKDTKDAPGTAESPAQEQPGDAETGV
jgi:hypothetical protein